MPGATRWRQRNMGNNPLAEFTPEQLRAEIQRQQDAVARTTPGHIDGAYIVIRMADIRGGFVVEAVPRPGRTGHEQDYRLHRARSYEEHPKSEEVLGYFSDDVAGMFALLRDQFIEGEDLV